MRTLLAGLLLFAFSATAQRSLNPVGGGSILRPGISRGAGAVTMAPGIQGPGLAAGMTPLGPVGGNVLGPYNAGGTRGLGGGYNRGSGSRRFGGGTGIIVPYPIYGAGGYSVVHNPPPGQYDPIFGVYNPGPLGQGYDPGSDAPSPVVVINQDFRTDTVRPQMRDYTNTPLLAPGPNYQQTPGAAAQPAVQNADTPMLLIAMKDHTIYPARAYWVEGSTLNYVTVDGVVNHASLDQVDRELSLKLNGERGLGFSLPNAR